MKNISIIFILFVCLEGCVLFMTNYDYSIDTKNIGRQMIDDVEITSQNGFWYETGYISPKEKKGIGAPQSVPPNDIYTIIIERQYTKPKKYVIDFRNTIRKDFRGDITFLIDDENNLTYELKTY